MTHRLLEVISKRFDEFGFPLHYDRNIIPDDDTTLFVCSGMQRLKKRFREKNGGVYGSIQSCIRTNDLDLVGDGSHLTYFEMIGNFSFGGIPYECSVQMWDSILRDLNWKVSVHVHPSRQDHRLLWKDYEIIHDPECVWSDGEIGGNCCEIYYGNLEIGNLVNPLGHSTDVGFGLERMIQVLESKKRVDETSLFDQSLSSVARDHVRSLSVMRDSGIYPGNKGRHYICRRLLRRVLSEPTPQLADWVEEEKSLLEKRIPRARKMWLKYKDKPKEWWMETCGVTPDEILSDNM